jgi:D-serine deaminase-like pyridoxal phosphate-dependent protein
VSQAVASDPQRYDSATAHIEPPFAVVDLAAMRANAAAMVRRAGPRPIRLASKSAPCRQLIEAVLRLDGFRCILARTLPQALWRSAPTYRGVGRAFL